MRDLTTRLLLTPAWTEAIGEAGNNYLVHFVIKTDREHLFHTFSVINQN